MSSSTEIVTYGKDSHSSSGAKAVPWLTIGFTDGAQLQKLGITCYGFTPVKLPPDLEFSKLYHGNNERIPIDGFLWGVDLLRDIVHEFCC